MSIVTTEARPIDTVRGALEKMKGQFAMALPKHLTPERLLRVALTAVQNTPKLLECDRTSLYSAVMTCAQLGLEPDGVLGQAYLVPFKGKVQFIPGYKGLISLARNSGDVVSISAHEVCENDHFEYAFGLMERLEHTPAKGDRGEVVAFYAYAKFKDGGHHFDVMSKAEVDQIRDNSQGWKAAVENSKKYQKPINSPWLSNYAEMGKKTAVRRIAKYLPLSVQKANAVADAADAGTHAHIDRYGDIVIDAQANETAEEAKTIEGTATKLDRFEQEGGESAHDPETGEIKPDAPQPPPAEPVGFWQQESLVIDPKPLGWKKWVAEILTRVGEAASIPDLDALDQFNGDHIEACARKSPELGDEVKNGFAAKRASLALSEG